MSHSFVSPLVILLTSNCGPALESAVTLCQLLFLSHLHMIFLRSHFCEPQLCAEPVWQGDLYKQAQYK